MEYRMYDLIMKKRKGLPLTADEIGFMVKGYTKGEIPDYQLSAFLMAVYFRGMNERETADLTIAMASSGDTADLSGIEGIKADKHSTGGVGDKTTLIVAPVVASLGLKIAKMSGKGLGHTGGTVDKLESIPGYKTTLGTQEFFDIVNKVGVSVVGQSGSFAPADKKIYALRDVTATVDIIPLIASSIMSKKLASGADIIVLDVKCGSGAFMKNYRDSLALAKEMVAIGKNAGKKTAALITDMDVPLGNYIGNNLEVIEACRVLKGEGPEDLNRLCTELSAFMLHLGKNLPVEKCKAMAQRAIDSGAAFEKFCEMVKAHGGDDSYLRETGKFPKAKYSLEIKSPSDGYIEKTDCEKCGIAACLLGAGRKSKEDKIDYSAGIILNRKTGDRVKKGDLIATLYTDRNETLAAAGNEFLSSLTFSENPPERTPIILGDPVL